MDAFFAAVEVREHPEYKGLPLVVGALPGNRGVVSTCSYEARTYGVKSAMPISEAVRRLPKNAIYVRPDMKLYSEVSRQLMELFADFSPKVEPLSVDEAFLDMTGVERLLGEPLDVAQNLADEIFKRLGITGSVGIAPNKFLAKLASDVKKPAGITMVPFEPEAIKLFLAPFHVGKLWGVGAVAQRDLALMGVTTVGDLQKIPENLLRSKFGKNGRRFSQIRFGIDERPLVTKTVAKSISKEHTFAQDEKKRSKWYQILRWSCDEVTRTARRRNVKGRTVTLTWRANDFKRHSASKTIPQGVDNGEIMYREIIKLADKNITDETWLRLIGSGLTNFDTLNEQQLSLFDTFETTADVLDEEYLNLEKKDRVLDELKKKFGSSIIVRGTEKK